MPGSKDIEREPTAEELLVLDLLYGEVNGDEAARASRRIEAEPDRADELAGFRNVRALLRELPDEEPPQAVSARLLHAAAEAAPAKGTTAAATAAAAGGGFLAKIFGVFRPLVASPGLAAATMLVLVAGIAGALYVSGGFRASEPKLADHEQLSPTTPAGTATASPQGATVEETVGGEALNDPNAAAPAETGRSARLDEGELDLTPEAEPAKPAPRTKADKPKDSAPARTRATSSSTTRRAAHGATKSGSYGAGDRYAPAGGAGKAEATMPSTGKTARGPSGVKGNAADTPMIDAEDVDQASPAPAQQPAAPPPPAADEKKPVSKKKQSTSAAKAEKTSSRVVLDDLHAKAVQAAKDGECDAVRSLGQRIRAVNATYYTKVFVADKRLTACRTAPAKK